MVGTATGGSRVNGAAAAASPPSIDPSSAASDCVDFSCREEVDRLLNEKMKGKNKTDYKVDFLSLSEI